MVPAQQRLHLHGHAGPQVDHRLVEADQLTAVERALQLRLGDERRLRRDSWQHPPSGLPVPDQKDRLRGPSLEGAA